MRRRSYLTQYAGGTVLQNVAPVLPIAFNRRMVETLVFAGARSCVGRQAHARVT